MAGEHSAVERKHSGVRKAVERTLKGLMLQSSLGVGGVTVIFAVVLAVFTQGFLTSGNVFNMSRTFSLWIIVGFSQMMVLTVGQMNLSAGAIGGLAAVTVGGLFQNLGAPVWLVILGGLGCGRRVWSVQRTLYRSYWYRRFHRYACFNEYLPGNQLRVDTRHAVLDGACSLSVHGRGKRV